MSFPHLQLGIETQNIWTKETSTISQEEAEVNNMENNFHFVLKQQKVLEIKKIKTR